MSKTTAIWAGALAALACAGSVRAHHSGSMFVTTATWVKGTVVRFEPRNPHSITTVEERSADGQVRRWAVEGPNQNGVARTNAPNVGDAIEFCAFAYKSPEELSRQFGGDFSNRRVDPEGRQFVIGAVLVTPDGAKQMWEPHGVLSECIRTTPEQRPSWLAFLSSNQRAREVWCDQKRYTVVQSNASLQELVEEIETSLDKLCG